MRAAVPELGSTAPNTHASRWLPRITVRSVCVYMFVVCGVCVCVCVCVGGGGGGGGGGGTEYLVKHCNLVHIACPFRM